MQMLMCTAKILILLAMITRVRCRGNSHSGHLSKASLLLPPDNGQKGQQVVQVDDENGQPLGKKVYSEDHCRHSRFAKFDVPEVNEQVPRAPHKKRQREDTKKEEKFALGAGKFSLAEPLVEHGDEGAGGQEQEEPDEDV